MQPRLLLELFELIVALALVIPGLRFTFRYFVRERRPDWSVALARRRLSLLLLALLAVIALNVGEDVLDRDAQALDVLALLAVRDLVSPSAAGFMQAVTLSGSGAFLTALTVAAALALWWARRRYEAFLLAASMIAGALTIYVVKLLVGRERPALWETEAYWGSSFPSGHTLAVAAFSIAAVLCTVRLRPALSNLSLAVAVSWIALVGASRLVLGVHWPSDVLVAACAGAALPLTISVLHELRQAGRPPR